MDNKFLSDEVLILKPNPRSGGMIKDKNHIGYFRYNGTYESFMLPKDDHNGGLVEIFKSNEERAFFAKELGITIEELNVRTKNNYFYGFQVKILKDDTFMQEGESFDLSNVISNLKWRILLKSGRVAPSFKERFNRGEYAYFLMEKNFKDKTDLSRIELNAKVWEHYGEIKDSSVKMYEFLFLYWLKNKSAIRPQSNPTLDYCKIQINRIIEADKKGFLEVFNSPSLKDEMLVYSGIHNGFIEYDGKLFFNAEKQQIGKKIEDVIYYFNDPRNSQEKLKLKANLKEITKNDKKK